MSSGNPHPPFASPPAKFESTLWSVVVEASQTSNEGAARALETLCRAYWYPLYAFVRREGMGPDDAADLTQDFFFRLLQKNWLADARPERGRFRSFLLAALRHFRANEWHKARRIKRGGGLEAVFLDAGTAEERYALEPADTASPDLLYERRWAMELLGRAQNRLKREMDESGQSDRFQALEPTLIGDQLSISNEELATRLGMTESNVRSMVSRLRKRFREVLRAEVAETIHDSAEVDAELGHLAAILRT